jgi:hypothetical protein
VSGPKGEVPAAVFLRFRLVDLVVHTWDLRRGAHLDDTLDPGLVVGLMNVVEPAIRRIPRARLLTDLGRLAGLG